MRVPWLPAAVLNVALAGLAVPCVAATFLVNSTADTTDGTCGTGAGGCTLREAIEAAVAAAGHDTIAFDPAVFPRGGAGLITLASDLPIVADPAGTEIDGGEATVFISGGGNVADGLVLASAPGQTLASPRVSHVAIQSVTGHALRICGGAPPSCDADVTNARVEAVTATIAGGSGIRIEGRNLTKTQVVDSVVQASGEAGIFLYGAQRLVGARVERCTARQSAGDGIVLSAGDAAVGSVVADSTALDSGLWGITVQAAGDVTRTRVTNCVALRSSGMGLAVNAGARAIGSSVSNILAAANGQNGILVRAVTAHVATRLQDAVGDGNGLQGIALEGPAQGLSVRRAAGVENTDSGLAMLTTSATGTKISDVVGAANQGSGGVLLVGTQCRAKRVLAESNVDAGIAVLESSACSIQRSRALANNSGITLRATSARNTVRRNVALGNAASDLYDANPACGSDVWAANAFGVGSPSCIH